MTKEQAIEVLRCRTNLGYGIVIENESTQVIEEALETIIRASEKKPSKCVSLGVYEQVAWERDVAIEQLKELGYSFGEKIKTSDDCVSRQAVIDLINADWKYEGLELSINELPPVTPTHGTCKDCKYRDPEDKKCDCGHTIQWQLPREDNWYCADFEKRGSENG